MSKWIGELTAFVRGLDKVGLVIVSVVVVILGAMGLAVMSLYTVQQALAVLGGQ